MTGCNPITIFELNERLSKAVASAPDVRNVWVVAETSDLRLSGGHCYMELVEKDANGANRSRIRAIVWSSTWRELNGRFVAATGSPLTSGIKIMACVTASYHQAYGMSVTISDIDPSFTLGDAVRRRNEIIRRLSDERIIDRNRGLAWPLAPSRVAVVSARGAAGFGDFVTHLLTNADHFRFDVELFPAVMQGDQTVPTVLSAMQRVARSERPFDVVVIIRGGGSTTDLAAFDSYDLARAVALFPVPVIIGIGHERDITVLDYVANRRVKTPTAAAELLVDRVRRLMDALGRAADKIYRATQSMIASNRELLAHAEASLPGLAGNVLVRQRLGLDRLAADIIAACSRAVERAGDKLERIEAMVKLLSPESVLARGYSLTVLPDGSVLRDAAAVRPGTQLTTRLAKGEVISITK